MTRALVPALLSAALAACSIAPPKPGESPRTYVLEGVAAPAAPADAHSPAALLIGPIKARPGFDTARMAYLLRPHELSFYASNEWADVPARMMGRVLRASVEKARAWEAVLPNSESARGDYRLDSEDFSVAQEFFGKPSKVRITLSARLVDLKASALVRAKEFEVVENAPSDDPYGGVVAANRAAAELSRQVTAWLNSPLP